MKKRSNSLDRSDPAAAPIPTGFAEIDDRVSTADPGADCLGWRRVSRSLNSPTFARSSVSSLFFFFYFLLLSQHGEILARAGRLRLARARRLTLRGLFREFF